MLASSALKSAASRCTSRCGTYDHVILQSVEWVFVSISSEEGFVERSSKYLNLTHIILAQAFAVHQTPDIAIAYESAPFSSILIFISRTANYKRRNSARKNQDLISFLCDFWYQA